MTFKTNQNKFSSAGKLGTQPKKVSFIAAAPSAQTPHWLAHAGFCLSARGQQMSAVAFPMTVLHSVTAMLRHNQQRRHMSCHHDRTVAELHVGWGSVWDCVDDRLLPEARAPRNRGTENGVVCMAVQTKTATPR